MAKCIYSTNRKLRVHRDGKIIQFIGGIYFYGLDEEKEVIKILKTVHPNEAVLSDQYGKQINHKQPIFKKVEPKKAKKVKGVTNGNSNNKNR